MSNIIHGPTLFLMNNSGIDLTV